MAKSSAKKQANQQYANDMEAMQQQRQWDLEDRDEAREYSRDVLKHLVTDAEEAGFNPLTVLRTGGGAGYNAAAGFAPLSRQVPSKQAVGGSPLGSAIQSAGQNFLANFDPFQDEKKELEFELVQAQIRNLNAGTAAYEKAPKAGSFNVPQYTATTQEKRPSGTAAALGKPQTPEAGTVTVTNPWKDHEVDPETRDAEGFTTRYGDSEVVSTGIGLKTLWADWDYNKREERAAADKKYRDALKQKHLDRQSRKTGGGSGW